MGHMGLATLNGSWGGGTPHNQSLSPASLDTPEAPPCFILTDP